MIAITEQFNQRKAPLPDRWYQFVLYRSLPKSKENNGSTETACRRIIPV